MKVFSRVPGQTPDLNVGVIVIVVSFIVISVNLVQSVVIPVSSVPLALILKVPSPVKSNKNIKFLPEGSTTEAFTFLLLKYAS